MIKERKLLSRKYQVDILRIFACSIVVFYHYFFFGPSIKVIPTLQNTYDISFYGFIGVDLFFIISGYVIIGSVSSNSLIKFAKSRIKRLYPTYWICLVLTVTVLVISEHNITLSQFIINLSMLQSFIHVDSIDGVYWTLAIEIVFYFWMAVFYYIFKKDKIVWMLLGWLTLSFINILGFFDFGIIKSLLLLNWIPYFIFGISIYLYFSKKYSFISIAPCMLLSYAILSLRTYQRTVSLSGSLSLEVNGIVSVLILFVCTLLFLLSFYFNVNFDKYKNIILKLSLATYPVYLLHQEIGYVLINLLNKYNYDFSFSRVLIYLIVFSFSVFIIPHLEKLFFKIVKSIPISHCYQWKNKSV